MSRRALVSALLALTGCAWFPPLPTPRLAADWATHKMGSDEIREASGIALAPHPDLFWIHNDSGNPARLFAGPAGLTGPEYAVDGPHVDWEDIARRRRPPLLGDIGNNGRAPGAPRVYRLDEPDPREPSRRVRVERSLPFHYADQSAFPDPGRAFDAEALYFADGALWILTKHRRDTGTTLYRLVDREDGAEQTLEPLQHLALIDSAPFGTVTAASASPDGRLVAVLMYTAIAVYERRADGTLDPQPRARIALEPRRTGQVEGITWDGRALLFCNERAICSDPRSAGPEARSLPAVSGYQGSSPQGSAPLPKASTSAPDPESSISGTVSSATRRR